MKTYTSILTLSLLLTLTASPLTATAFESLPAAQQPETPSLYRGSGR
jgi:hypothetical protein